jgi:hypothetical protein
MDSDKKELRKKSLSIKIQWIEECYKLPEYINTSSTIDYVVYHNYRLLLDTIGVMINTTTMSDKRIDELVDQCNEKMDRICSQWLKDDRLILLINRIDGLFYFILEKLEENELFESCDNLKRFEKRFFIDE